MNGDQGKYVADMCVHVCGRKGELWKKGQSPKRYRPWSRCWLIIQRIWSGTLCIVRTISSATVTAEGPESESKEFCFLPSVPARGLGIMKTLHGCSVYIFAWFHRQGL